MRGADAVTVFAGGTGSSPSASWVTPAGAATKQALKATTPPVQLSQSPDRQPSRVAPRPPNCSKHFIPNRRVLDHHFSQQPNGRHAVPQHLIVKLLQGVTGALLFLIIAPE